MTRTLIQNAIKKTGKKILLEGWVNSVRDHGKITFLDIRDQSGLVQVICPSGFTQKLHQEDVVSITGLVTLRPEKLINPKLATGTIEIQASSIEILSPSEELPFDMGQDKLDLQLPTLLDNRCLTLRHPRVRQIFRVQEAVMQGFRNAAQKLGCTEVFTPTISASSTEGGSEVFKVKYYDHEAFMVQSPQLYKQMMVPVFERVFLVSHAYRAEPSITTRHLSESIQMDCELGFVNFADLLDAIELVGIETLKHVRKTCADVLANYSVGELKIDSPVPRLTMREAQKIVLDRTGIDHTTEIDLMPEDEREICRWALEVHNSDLVNVTHYPTKKRAFYTMPDPKNPEFSLSYDLLFRGMEILSGSQRINKYDEILAAIKNRGMNPENFAMYLQAFKYGMPPEGGFSYGLERLTMQILRLENVREASLFPRDMERIDFRLKKPEVVK